MSSCTAILGFGITGRAVARYLRERGEAVVVLDTRPEFATATQEVERLDLRAYWNCRNWPDGVLAQVDRVVVSPGIAPNHCLLSAVDAAHISRCSDIDLFLGELAANQRQAKVIGVTGTNGKSTVVSLVGHVLRGANIACVVGGNLGTPALDLLAQKASIYVLELSSFQLVHSHVSGLAAVTILNVSDDHLDYHLTMEAYLQSKRRIYSDASWIVTNREDERLSEDNASVSIGLSAPGNQVDWGLLEGVSAAGEETQWLACGDDLVIDCADLPLHGRHNLLNCMMALALVTPWVSARSAAGYLRGFSNLPHRFEVVGTIAGVRFVNDSKATNVGSTQAALCGFEKTAQVVLIAGGDSKHADIAPLGAVMRDRVSHLVALGQDAGKFCNLAESIGVSWSSAVSMEDAVGIAVKAAKPGDTVLLSPASASLDMYRNFAERGENFAAAVASLGSSSSISDSQKEDK